VRPRARFPGRAAIQQRVVPLYRAAFFEALAARCTQGLDLFAGVPRGGEEIRPARSLERTRWHVASNVYPLGSSALCLQMGVVDWLRRVEPDVLVVEANPRYLATPAAIAWMHRRGRPVLGWGLGAPPGPGGWWRRRFLRGLDGVMAYSTRGAAQYAAAGVPVERIWVAPNAVEAPAPRPPRRAPLRRRPARLIYVGRLQRRKRVDHLIRACARLAPRPELWIVGGGPDHARLASIAARTFPTAVFTGPVHGSELLRLLDLADLFVLPGTGGLAVQQAMARALPIVAGRGDGSQEDMVTPANGWLVPPDDAAALAGALDEALRSGRRLASMGAASHRLARERFHPRIMVEVFVRALRAVAEA